MKGKWIRKALSCMLAGAMLFNMAAAGAYAEESTGGKYVSDVFIAYGKTEKDAQKWLTDNGWEPVEGDFNAGKASFFDDNKIQDQNVAAVMGIKRTDKADEAITDMAVINMKGGYSIPEYEKLLEEKKAQIDEFVNHFMVVIKEYRANYNGEGGDYGKERAKLTHDLLNKFYDGGEDEPYADHDTGKKLGDLFLDETREEGNEAGADLQQLILESSGPAITMAEVMLALSADTGEEAWLKRAAGLTGDELSANLAAYVPEAEGQDLPESAALQMLNQQFEDTAVILAEQWGSIHDQMTWYKNYCDANGLWPEEGEADTDYEKRVNGYFADLEKADDIKAAEEQTQFADTGMLYSCLYEFAYAGEWGETLGDFFNPQDGSDYTGEVESFLPMAAALSDGQRAALDFLPLQTLLTLGFGSMEGFEKALPDIKEALGDQEEVSIYLGVNRAAFRGGVALTNEALMEQNAGRGEAFDKIWDNTGVVAITAYCAAAVGAISMIAGGTMMHYGWDYFCRGQFHMLIMEADVKAAQAAADQAVKDFTAGTITEQQKTAAVAKYETLNSKFTTENNKTYTTNMGITGRWVLGIGGALLVAAAIVKGIQLWKYYDRDMTPIPLMIVDESDIVTYVTDNQGNPVLDENGNQKKNIDFDTYEFYTSVKCNRPDVDEIGDWQDGVKEYKDHNCFDVADLNADMGQEWIALYTVKSSNKGCPILADSLKLQYGDSKVPEGCTKALHLFTYTNAVDLGDTAWAFNNDKKGVYFFWDEDTKAYPAAETASTFGGGHLALAGIIGLALGIGGSTLALRPRRKEKEQAETTD